MNKTIEKNRESALLRVLITLGIVFFVVNFFLYYLDFHSSLFFSITVLGYVVQIILGISIVILSLKISNAAYQLFLGMILSGWGILSGLVYFILPWEHNVWWPFYLITASIFLFISGLKKYKKVKFGFLLPSLCLFSMGIVFALFSFSLMKISFKTFIIYLGPSFICLSGIFLVLLFLFQKHHKDFVFNDEDTGDFDDEDLIFPKLD